MATFWELGVGYGGGFYEKLLEASFVIKRNNLSTVT